jgi:lipopolysaccharide/colanic/teichoic acid biosynthesis glycosyltransferase
LPVIALIIKLASRSPVITTIETTGKRGVAFLRYKFTTRNKNGEDFSFGKFLENSGLEKLPSIINVWMGEMNLVGPLPYSVDKCNYWNTKISDFYKRFSFKPGYFGVTPRISEKENIVMVENNLAYELRYIMHTSVDQDLRHIIR